MLIFEARRRRDQHKEKMGQLKRAYKKLQTEIEELRDENAAYQRQYNRLRNDVDHAQKALNHSEELHGFVEQLATIPEANIRTLIAEFTTGHEIKYQKNSKDQKNGDSRHGICLHVQNGNFSVKFCGECDSHTSDNW